MTNLRVFSKKTHWITHSMLQENVLQVEKEFNIVEFSSVKLTICGLGFFSIKINGLSCDEDYYKPIVSDYQKRDISKNKNLCVGNKYKTYYYEYDISSYVKKGQNKLDILLGNGYYHNVDHLEEPFISYGDKRVIFEIQIKDGENFQVIGSDETTKVRYLNVLSNLYDGDYIDFSKDPSSFEAPILLQDIESEMLLADMPSDRIQDKIYPVSVEKREDRIIYDFGINHSGGVNFKVQGKKGQTIKLKFAEVLDKDGNLNLKTSSWEEFDADGCLLHEIDQVGEYVLSGKVDVVTPMFSWHCYRYVEVEGAIDCKIEDFCSYYIYTNVKKIGCFSSDNKLLNDLYAMSMRSINNNFHAGLLTDCPHREKRPYIGDGHVVTETMLYDLECESFFAKWLDDMINAQQANGFVPYTVPYLSGGGGYAWSSAIAVIPDYLYRLTGNVEYLKKSYASIAKWIDYCKQHIENGRIKLRDQIWQLGDWLAPEVTQFDVDFMSTLWYYKSVSTQEFFAKILNKKEDIKVYRELKKQLANTINEVFFDNEKTSYCNGIQGENVLPVAFGVIPTECVEKINQKIKQTYVSNDYHFDTGFIATPILLEYLTTNGMEDIAYRLMTATDYPSYKNMMDGETTLCEHWSKKWPDYYVNDKKLIRGGGEVSHCHHMFGSVVAWMYKYVAGINLSRVFEKKIYFTPKFFKYFNNAYAQTKVNNQDAIIKWQKNVNEVVVDVVIPNEFVGEFCLPNGMTVKAIIGDEKKVNASKETLELESGQWKILLNL